MDYILEILVMLSPIRNCIKNYLAIIVISVELLKKKIDNPEIYFFTNDYEYFNNVINPENYLD